MFAADLIDQEALLNVVWVSALAVVGGTAAFSLAIVGATRFVDLRRAGRTVEAAMFGAVAGLALLVFLGGVVIGLYAIIEK
jgi:hypothetical protein